MFFLNFDSPKFFKNFFPKFLNHPNFLSAILLNQFLINNNFLNKMSGTVEVIFGLKLG